MFCQTRQPIIISSSVPSKLHDALSKKLSRIRQAFALGIFCSLSLVCSTQTCWSQAPPFAELQESRVLDQASSDRDKDGIPVDGIYFMDNGNRVYLSNKNWERYQLFSDSESGIDNRVKTHSNFSLFIEGVAQEGEIELTVTLKVDVASTEGQQVEVPLQMSGFFMTGKPTITSESEDASEEFYSIHSIQTTTNQTGLLLSSKSNHASQVTIQFPAVCRVDKEGDKRTVHFDLPGVLSVVSITSPQTDLVLAVDGRGNEVISTTELDGHSTMMVQSSGGQFSLSWTSQEQITATEPIMETDSSVHLSWESPQDHPIQETYMTIQSSTGNLSSFLIDLPPGSILLDPPTIDSSSTNITIDTSRFEKASDNESSHQIEVLIPALDQVERVTLSIKLRLANDNASARSPLLFQVPTVIGAIHRGGELQVKISDEYRLRWRRTSWVQNNMDRSSFGNYSFHFDRDEFQLPLWLATQQRQLRLETETQLSLHDSAISLVMIVRPSGQMIQGSGLKIDLSGWQLRSIDDWETGIPLVTVTENEIHEVEIQQFSSGELSPFRIEAEYLASRNSDLSMVLPRIIEMDENTLVRSSTLTVQHTGRWLLSVDLPNSVGIDRIEDTRTSPDDDHTSTRYRILPTEEPTQLHARIIEQFQQVTLQSATTVERDGNQLLTDINWRLSSRFDLEGRLPVRIPRASRAAIRNEDKTLSGEAAYQNAFAIGSTEISTTESGDNIGIDLGSFSESAPTASSAFANEWQVTVNDDVATLSWIRADEYEIVSDRLTSEEHDIHWRRSQTILDDSLDDIHWVPLPRPHVNETIPGLLTVDLLSDYQSDLVSVDHPELNQFVIDHLPREPLRLRILPLIQGTSSSVVRRAVIRTIAGHHLRREEIYASVEGGELFSITLSPDAKNISVRALVDGVEAQQHQHENTIDIVLPSHSGTHLVEVKLSIPVSQGVLSSSVEPMVRIAGGVERVYWQLLVPSDFHLLWSSPTIGRAMSWQFDRWGLTRHPTMSSDSLAQWIGSSRLDSVQVGNEYLYHGNAVSTLQAVTISRFALWMFAGSLVLACSACLAYLPFLRHPLVAIATAILLAGLSLLAPDAAVLVGQWLMYAMILLVVVLAVRSMIQPTGLFATEHHGGLATNQSLSPLVQVKQETDPMASSGPMVTGGRRATDKQSTPVPGNSPLPSALDPRHLSAPVQSVGSSLTATHSIAVSPDPPQEGNDVPR